MQLIFGVLRSDCGNENIMKLQDNAMYVVGAYVNGVYPTRSGNSSFKLLPSIYVITLAGTPFDY